MLTIHAYMLSQEGEVMTGSSSDDVCEVLDVMPPGRMLTLGRLYMILELADRREEAGKLLAEKEVAELQNMLLLAAKKVQVWSVLLLLMGLRVLAWLGIFFRLVRQTAVHSIEQIEHGLSEAAGRSRSEVAFGMERSTDERHAEQAVKNLRDEIGKMRQRYSADNRIVSYLDVLLASAIAIGQRRGEAEHEYRKVYHEAEVDEDAYRTSFIVRCFGIGTVKLIQSLLAILVLGMSIPFAVEYFIKENPDYSTPMNIMFGLATTVLVFVIVIGLRLFTNDRRVASRRKKAKIDMATAEMVRAEKTAAVLRASWLDLSAAYTVLRGGEPPEDQRILFEEMIAEQNFIKRRKELELKALKAKLTLAQKLVRIADVGSQSDITGEAGDALESIIG